MPSALQLKAMEWLERLHLANLAKNRSVHFRGTTTVIIDYSCYGKHPPILILDEPLQGLDGVNRKLVKQFIEQLVTNSQTQLLFVSHQDADAPNCITHLFEFVPQDNGGYRYMQTALS
ncbi:molybdenum transport ATP-binding protein ModF [Actinobacillus equuli]|nr:molybdenum transport ATP-binding protein ModF [Actinobacillus equuli]